MTAWGCNERQADERLDAHHPQVAKRRVKRDMVDDFDVRCVARLPLDKAQTLSTGEHAASTSLADAVARPALQRTVVPGERAPHDDVTPR